MNFYMFYFLLYLSCIAITNGDEDHNASVIFLEKIQSSHDVSDKFLSFGLDSSLLRYFKKLPINNDKFLNLGYHLKPSYIRIGGTAADCLYFNQTYTQKYLSTDNFTNDYNPNNISSFSISGENFLSLFAYTQKIGSKMVFDLNTLLRNPDGSWNSSNAEEIILYAKGHNLELDWQMGNEPNSFHHVFNVSVSAKQFAKDYCKLRKILNKSGYKDSILVGPEANHIGDKNKGNKYVKNFLKKGADCISYVTWHQYYLNGHIAVKEDFLNASVYERLPDQINTVKEAIKLSGQTIPMWISETSSAYGGGAPGLSDRFIAGFLWLDKLGISAQAGVQVVVRQSIFGGDYAMIGSDLEPNPDWWVSVLYKKFVSSRVLSSVGSTESDSVRLYAHCASKQSPQISKLVIYGMNLYDQARNIVLNNAPKTAKVYAYFLTSDDLESRRIFLNGELLKLQSDGSLPIFKPKIMDPTQFIKLPPHSMVFLLINGVKVSACKNI